MTTQPPEIYEKLSQKYNLPIETIRDIVIWFWRNGVKRSLEGVVNTEIYINKLGSFKIKQYKVPYVMPNVIQLLENPDIHPNSLEYFTLLRDRLTIIQQMIEDKKIKNKEFRELFQQNSTNISKSETNLGGPKKQGVQE